MPGDFCPRTPTVDGSRSFCRIAAKQHLDNFLARVLACYSTADIAAADIILPRPEKKQPHSGGHLVVVLDNSLGRGADPLEGLRDRLAIRLRRGSGRKEKENKKQAQTGESCINCGPHAWGLPFDSWGIRV